MPRINSRSKGIRGERDVIDRLQPVVNECFLLFGKQTTALQRNTLQYDDGGSDIAGLDFLAIEIKNCATLQLKQWWEEAVGQAEKANKHQTPIMIYKSGRGVHRVRMWGQILTTLSDPQTCVVDIDWDAFLAWFKTELFGYLATENQTKTVVAQGCATRKQAIEAGIASLHTALAAPTVPTVAIKRDLPATMREQFKLAEAWCVKNGWPVPAKGTPERSQMLDFWANAYLNGEA